MNRTLVVSSLALAAASSLGPVDLSSVPYYGRYSHRLPRPKKLKNRDKEKVARKSRKRNRK